MVFDRKIFGAENYGQLSQLTLPFLKGVAFPYLRMFFAVRLMKGSTVFLVMLGLVIAGVGGLFTWLMGMSYMRAVEQRTWPQVQGVVLSSKIEKYKHDDFSPMEYRMNILYGYEWKGERKTGERYGFRGNPKYNKQNKIAGLVETYPVGKKIMVYVNPKDVNFTMLKPDSKAAGYSIWFPMLFVIGGLGIALRAIRAELRAKSGELRTKN